jgi:hypothetical protein
MNGGCLDVELHMAGFWRQFSPWSSIGGHFSTTHKQASTIASTMESVSPEYTSQF